MNFIIPEKDLWDSLLRVAKPGRYTGGEYGICSSDNKNFLFVALSYPDLYEIGMSNHAIKILYSLINSVPGVKCERVFVPAPDFEEELRKKNIPLYSLESGKPLNEFDIICFSVGYELNATGILTILDLGNINLFSAKRTNKDPVVFAGGPAVTNPVPFSLFIDSFFIGEAEDKMEELFTDLCQLKKQGAKRQDLLSRILSEPSTWSMYKKDHIAAKNTWMGFPGEMMQLQFPISNIGIVQDQGVTEIMRGCPNKCRFCHASIFYRPYRLKNPSIICSEIEHLIIRYGYRKITLSSLSSGDYNNIDTLVRFLAERYRQTGVSFSLPSLRINSFVLSLLKDISSVRKSGLTFAVETPDPGLQGRINKNVSPDRTIALLQEAKRMGWKLAKFYFMIGLPLCKQNEADSIVSFIEEVRKKVKIQLNITLSTFIPKPHTPFQWASQLPEEEALARVFYIKKNISSRFVKISFHSPFSSMLEGLISRGNVDVGNIIYKAFKSGARLDAWDDFINRDIWQKTLNKSEGDIVSETLSSRGMEAVFPWNTVSLGVTKEYLRKEWERALKGEYTAVCSSPCSDHCGICGKKIEILNRQSNAEMQSLGSLPSFQIQAARHKKLLLSFSKTGKAAFLSHLNSMKIFERALLRAGYLPCFTKGFNPKPILEFASPLALGLESSDEIISCEIENFDTVENVINKMNDVLPQGFQIIRGKELPPYIDGTKKISLAGLYWGSDLFFSSSSDIKKIIHIFSMINDVNNEEDELFVFSKALDSFFMMGNGLCIRWKKIDKKGFNILYFISKLTGQTYFNAGIKIKRLNSLAKGKNNRPEHYFDVL